MEGRTQQTAMQSHATPKETAARQHDGVDEYITGENSRKLKQWPGGMQVLTVNNSIGLI